MVLPSESRVCQSKSVSPTHSHGDSDSHPLGSPTPAACTRHVVHSLHASPELPGSSTAGGPHYRCEIGEGARCPTTKLCCSQVWGSGWFGPLVRCVQPPFEFDPSLLHTASHENVWAMGKSHTRAHGHMCTFFLISHTSHLCIRMMCDHIHSCMSCDHESVTKIWPFVCSCPVSLATCCTDTCKDVG